MISNFAKQKEQEKEEKSKSDEIHFFIDSIGDLVFVIDKNRIITKVNKATCDTFKKTPQQITGRHCYELVHGTKGPWCNCPATQTFKTKQVVTEEVNDPNLGVPLLVTTSPILDEQGEVSQVIHVAKDITKIKQAEIEMHIAANLLEAASDSVILHDIEGKIVYFNEAAYKTRGYTKSEFQKLSIRDLESPKTRKFFISRTKELLESGEASFETVNLSKDKTEIPVEIHARIIELDGKKMVLTVARDNTERKRISDELKLSEERLRTIFENAPDAYYMSDLKGNFVDGNKKAEEIVGYSRNELIGNSFLSLNLLPRNQILKAAKLLSLNAIGKSSGPDEFVLNRKNGTQIPVEIRTHPLKIQGKNIVLGIARDISQRKAAEEKLREIQEKYEITFESSVDALMLLDEKGFFDCNKSALTLFGIKSVEELSKCHPADLSPSTQPDGTSSIESANKHINNAFRKGMDSFFWVHKRVDGTAFPANVLLSRITLKDQNVLQATVRDITQQKQDEEKLKQSEEKHRTLLNVANVLVQSVNAENKYVFVNEEWKKVLGYTDQDLKNMTIKDVVREDELKHCAVVFKQVMEGVSIHDVETIFVAKDGREITVSGNACPIFKDNEFVSTVAFFVDTTEKKKIEENLKENNRRIELMVEKLRVVGGLTRHDVRNKLSTVTGYAYLLKKKHADEADVVEGLSKMELAVRDSMKIFEFAKLYEQLGAEELTYIDVGAKFDEAVALFDGSLPKIMNECHGLTVWADSFLRQMFYNFIDNTRKYGQRTAIIKVYYKKTDQGNLVLTYEDDGVGISAENKLKLFSEGFSTGGSTGFGLFLTKKMIDVYGWEIAENGTPGEGAKFTITIPKLNKNRKENYQTA